ncbi:MAG: AlpA family phage regulatory protein [Chromatiaceae bacterium]|nr:AlpA family phage regulatory protein [Chromatiaceae bacterium]
MRQLPEEGFCRIAAIIGDKRRNIEGIFPVSRSEWYAGIKSGKYPAPVKLGARLSVWRVQDVRRLLVEIGHGKG